MVDSNSIVTGLIAAFGTLFLLIGILGMVTSYSDSVISLSLLVYTALFVLGVALFVIAFSEAE